MRDLLAQLLPLLLELLLYFGFSCSDVDRPVMATCLTLMSSVRRIQDTYLAAPKGFDLEPALEGLGEARGEGVAEVDEERGRSSSLRLPICGVGGVELLAGQESVSTC